MRAVGHRKPGAITRPDALLALDLPEPEAPGGFDLVVEVRAVSVNPDVKVRSRAAPDPNGSKVLGWDAAGVVRAVGPQVSAFHPGDAVFYAGAIGRQGSNSERQLVDARASWAASRRAWAGARPRRCP